MAFNVEFTDEDGEEYDVTYDVDEDGDAVIVEVTDEEGESWDDDELEEEDPELHEEIMEFLEDLLDDE
jgi:hypothetical protein|tara:strand:+ start:204 stop:407 length:204 start_codon:yes stop_codon:yes gene_type:complete